MEVGRPGFEPRPGCVQGLCPLLFYDHYFASYVGSTTAPRSRRGQRNKLIGCFLPPPPPQPRSWGTGCSSDNGRLRPSSRPELARGTPVLCTPRAGYGLPLARSLRVAPGCSGGPPTLLPLPRLGQGWWAVQRVVSAVLGHWMVEWAAGGASVHFTGEETESGRLPCSTGGRSPASAGGGGGYAGRTGTSPAACHRPPRPAQARAPRAPRAGPACGSLSGRPRPLSPLSDLTAARPESRHVRWSHGADLDASPSCRERGMQSWPPPSCKASSCV